MRERLIILVLRIDISYGKEIGNSGRKAAAAVNSFWKGVVSLGRSRRFWSSKSDVSYTGVSPGVPAAIV
jgi:hypothetical protein